MATGKLVVIGTPIGNLKDITFRAIDALNLIEVLVCEDTRVTSQLLHLLANQGLIHANPRLIVCNEFNEFRVAPTIVELVNKGTMVGLVSDAGMPALSDPGFRIIRGCYDNKLQVEIIPGVSSLTMAMVAAGLGGEQIFYIGFLPKKPGKREAVLSTAHELMNKTSSLRTVIYVSPHKIVRELSEIREIFGNAHAVLLREMTKKFEERIESSIDDLIALYEKKPPKGEMVLVIQEQSTESSGRS